MKIVVRDGTVMDPERDYNFSPGTDAPIFKGKLRITNTIQVYDTKKDYMYRWKVKHRKEWTYRCEKMEVPPGHTGYQGVEFELVLDGGWKDE